MASGTKYTTKQQLLDAIQALVYENDDNLTESDNIQKAAKDIVETIWDKTVPVGAEDQTLRYDVDGNLVVNDLVKMDSTGNILVTNSFLVGQQSTTGLRNVVVGQVHTVAGNNNSVSGYSNIVPGDYNTVTGSANQVLGDLNIVGGSSNYVLSNNNILSGNNNAATVDANNSIVSGNGNTIQDENSLIIGNGNNVSGTALIIGSNNTGSSNGATVIIGGYGIVSGGVTGGYLYGFYGKLLNSYTRVFSNSNGTSTHQEETSINFGQSVNNTPTPIGIDGVDGSFLLKTGTLYKVKVTFVGIQSGGAAGTIGDSSTFVYTAAYKNIGGVVTIVGAGSTTEILSNVGASTWVGTVDISGTSITPVVTGEVNKTIQWTAKIETINSGY